MTARNQPGWRDQRWPDRFTTSRAYLESDAIMQRIRRRHGMMMKIATMLGIPRWRVENWRSVPLAFTFKVAQATGIRPEEIAPEFFADDPLRQTTRRRQSAAPSPALAPSQPPASQEPARQPA